MRRLVLLGAVLSCAAYAQPLVIANDPLDAPVNVEPARDPGGRVRWGLGGGIGWHSPYGAWGLNLEGRVGTQLGSVLSAYFAIGAHLGAGVGIGAFGLNAGAQGTLLGHFTMGALVELLLFHHLSVAAGPAFGLGAMGLGGLNIAVNGGSVSAVSSAGFKPGFDVRLGWGFHSPNPRTHKRRGFNVGVDVLTLFHLNGIVTEVVTDFSGTQTTVQKAQTLITVTPMLTLSYESR
ncbi:MAG: hypothetical protein JNM17_26775 [Archangium sp.]|nr:hypothetical protein [Archangium sp.]